MSKLMRILIIPATLLSPVTSQADALTVIVMGIKDSMGNVRIAVHNSESSYKAKDGQPVAASAIQAATPQVTYSTDLPPGQYAIKVMHDVDGDDKLDRNLVGMPTEPFGFSNDAKANFGPPKWKATVFALEGETTVTINLVH